MIISNDTANKRLHSPNNLMNRLKELKSNRHNAMTLFTRRSAVTEQTTPEPARAEDDSFNPFQRINPTVEEREVVVREEIPKFEDLVPNSNEQVKLGLAHDTALRILQESMESLHTRLPEVKADKLVNVISVTSKVVEGIRKERIEVMKNQGKDKEVHYHFYTPQQKKVDDYTIIDIQPQVEEVSP